MPPVRIPERFLPTRARPKERVGVNAWLFIATVLTTTLVGIDHYLSFLADFRQAPSLPWSTLAAGGLYYSVTVLLILGMHELGHYFACRYYRVDASLPYFIPVPGFVLSGTLGAFIKIREPIRSKRALFDIGIAGPLAGFVVAVPALILGIAWSHVVPLPKTFNGALYELGESLLFQWVTWGIWGNIPAGYTLNMHPVALAAWFGLLATSFNLFPIGQLDGGHISYAVFGRRSTWITYAAVATAICLVFVSMSWLVWTILVVAMLYVFGPHHPSTQDEEVRLDVGRLVLAFVALVVFVLSFTQAPLELVNFPARS